MGPVEGRGGSGRARFYSLHRQQRIIARQPEHFIHGEMFNPMRDHQGGDAHDCDGEEGKEKVAMDKIMVEKKKKKKKMKKK